MDYLFYKFVLYYISHKMSNLWENPVQKYNIFSDYVQKQNIDLLCQVRPPFAIVPLRTNGDKVFDNNSPFVSYRPFEILFPSNGLFRGHMLSMY